MEIQSGSRCGDDRMMRRRESDSTHTVKLTNWTTQTAGLIVDQSAADGRLSLMAEHHEASEDHNGNKLVRVKLQLIVQLNASL